MLIGRRGSKWCFVLVSAPPLSNPSYVPVAVEVDEKTIPSTVSHNLSSLVESAIMKKFKKNS